MASGLSNRFGGNKLLAEFKGRRLIDIIVDKTGMLGESFAKDTVSIDRLVLTRTREVSEYCTGEGVPVILHQLPTRNEAIALGMERMAGYDACMFVGCDQPLLRTVSIKRVIEEFLTGGRGIYRLSIDDLIGNPILFSKEYFPELMALPEKKGGAYLARKYPDEVRLVSAVDKWELADIDTPDDLVLLSSVGRNEK